MLTGNIWTGLASLDNNTMVRLRTGSLTTINHAALTGEMIVADSAGTQTSALLMAASNVDNFLNAAEIGHQHEERLETHFRLRELKLGPSVDFMVGGFPPMRWETQKPLFTSLRAPFHISLPCNCWAMRRLQLANARISWVF